MAVRLQKRVRRGPQLTIMVDGDPVIAYGGESVAAAMLAADRRTLRLSPREAAPRGVFCLMGACQECVVQVDGRRVLACQETVTAGMDVKTGGYRE